ncbi:dTDP-4-dehydrorhamnose reductase [Megasphaera sueciensis]|uniref:dTDP-4-dehydrorhamnose reductase n=1 Tax=Megasphaera sueciensis TaxID=349094 RepID=UPI003CFD5A4E
MMKVAVTGVGGQLGYEVVQELRRCGIDCVGADLAEFDITDFAAAHRFLTGYGADAVIHCSAYTAVDKAESNRDICHKVNVLGTENIAKICREMKAKMVYISTDYVFDGKGTAFRKPEDPAAPLNFYGQTKWEGEEAVRKYAVKHFIVRISWAFGKNGSNFIKTMLRLGKEQDEVSVVDDQIGSPTYMADLAPLLCDMVRSEAYGTYHATNEGICSFAEFAEEIFRQAGIPCRVKHIPTSAYPTPAKRPLNSRMSKDKLVQNGFRTLPDWQDAVRRFLIEEGID